MRKGVRILQDGYSSPYGRVHNSRITTEPKIYSGSGALMNSINAGHVMSGSNENNMNILPETENTLLSENLVKIPESQMTLYSFYGAFENEFFETEEEVLNYLRYNGHPHTSICIIEYLGNFAGHTDVIKRSFKNDNQIIESKLLSIHSDDCYSEYDQQSSMRLGKHIWKHSYGTLRIIYSAFRNREIVLENDIYAKIDEKNNQYTLTKKK